MSMFSLPLTLALTALLAPPPEGLVQAAKPTAPESFTATADVVTTAGSSSATITMTIERYSVERTRTAVEQALEKGGYPSFLLALRQAPIVGTLSIGGQSFNIRYAREASQADGRSIVLVTEKPVFFVGGGATDAKPRAGYEVAVVSFRVGDDGVGREGTMAAAARVKPGGETGVRIDDYAEKPITLRTITRSAK